MSACWRSLFSSSLASAHAHIIDADGAGLAQGFSHPFIGLDHILVMVAVGIWAAQVGRPSLWVLPVAFPLAMAGGGLLGVAGVPVPGVEAGIAASVLGLGLLIAFQAKPPLALSIALVALFALFHGHPTARTAAGRLAGALWTGLRPGDGRSARDRPRRPLGCDCRRNDGRSSRRQRHRRSRHRAVHRAVTIGASR